MNNDDKLPGSEPELESSWVKAAQANDRQAFDRLLRRYQNKVFNICYRMLSDYEEANDCAQETFVKIYRSLKHFRQESSFATWVYTIAVNTCKNRLQSAAYRNRKRMLSIDPAGDAEDRGPSREIEDPAPSAFAQLALQEREALLQRAIDGLPEEARVVIVLRDVEGLPYEEITRITGYPLGTVKSRLARARQQLRERLKGVI
jgi:RNA polymerase sigma-70 factor, ECF subfamily